MTVYILELMGEKKTQKQCAIIQKNPNDPLYKTQRSKGKVGK